MFKSLTKSKYPTGMLYFLTEHTLIIYVQYIKGSKRKTSYLLEKLFEKDLVDFVSDSIFKRLNFDNSSSETVFNQKIKTKNYFLTTAYFWGSDKLMEINYYPIYEKQMSNGIFKFVQINMKHFLYTVRFVCLFVALRPKSTAMVIAGWSVHLTTLFPGQA